MKNLIPFFAFVFFSISSHARTINFEMPLNGIKRTYGQNQLKDKILVFEWFNKGCPFVKKFYSNSHMQKLQKKWTTNKNIIWFNVLSSAEGKQGHEKKLQASKTREVLNINSTDMILDQSGKLGRLFGAVATPHFFIIRNNEVLYEGAIDSIPNTESGDIPKATNYVELALTNISKNLPVKIKKTKAYGCSVKY